MKHVIKFSESTSYKFDVNEYLANYYYLKNVKDFIMSRYKYRGYIYLNQIYEAFAVRWNPLKENLLFTCTYGVWGFDIDIEKLEDEPGYNIVIDIYE